MSDAPRDQNFVPTALGESSTTPGLTLPFLIDEITGRLLCDVGGAGSGTVTSVSVVSANGFAGTVATATTTPAITLTTTITGILKGNGTAISAVTIGSGLAYDGTTLSATSGGGNVSNTGTPLANEIAIWTDATTVKGVATLTFNSATDTLTVGAGAGIIITHALRSDASGGIIIEAANGTDVGLLGVGNTANVTWYGAHNFDTATQDTIAAFTGAGKTLGSLALATYPSLTELSYVKGVTSAIQTQLNAKQATITFGTGVETALGINIGSAGAVVLFNGALGTPSSGTVTNLTGTASININGTVGATTPTTGVFTTATVNTGLLPDANDGAYLGQAGTAFSDLFLAEGGVINWDSGDVTITQTNNVLAFAGATYTFDGTLSPASNDGAALGTTALQFSDIFLAEGAVINFDNGDLTLAQSGNTLTLAGGDFVLAENTSIALDPSLSADGTWTGTTITGTAGYTQAFGDVVYLDPTDSRWEACDANAASGADGDSRGLVGMVVVAGTDGNACTILLNGVIRADANFPALTVNNPIYISETAGDITQTQPTTTDVVIRIIGAALTADSMYFNPDQTWITHT